MKQEGLTPSPTEQTLFAIWDAIDRARTRQGEAVAQQLACTALAAIVAAAPSSPPAAGHHRASALRLEDPARRTRGGRCHPTAWLDQQLTTMRFSQNEGAGMTITQAEHWQKRLTLTQGRYLRALETLARIRKLSIRIQVNIAAGGQQVLHTEN